MKDEFDNFIMERSFETLDANGNVGTIHLHLGQPYFVTENMVWLCPFQMTGVLQSRLWQGVGIDTIGAVLNSLHMARQLLEVESRSYNLQITWQGKADLGLYTEPPHDDLPDETRSKFDFEKVFDEIFEKIENKRKQKPS